MRVFLFPGCGSQYCGMGKEWFDAVPEYAAVEAEIDSILGYSLRDLCLRGPESQLKDTRYASPCMFVVNALCYYDIVRTSGPPDAVAGHSMGEYNALLAAGAFDMITGVRLVTQRAEIMAGAKSGAMAAVLKVASGRIVSMLKEDPSLAGLDVANFNSPLQTVIVGPEEVIRRARSSFEREGATYVELPVNVASHSKFMLQVVGRFERFLEPFSFGTLSLPVISNVTAEPYPCASRSGVIKSMLVRQLTNPVRWTATIQRLCAMGATEFIEVGPGKVLTRLLEQIRLQVPPETLLMDNRFVVATAASATKP
ncbi:MAG TPA: ACP S-malonyltransferase [Candidatus Angelobacter sp.]